MALPPIDHTADPARPVDVGLYSAASLVDIPPPRMSGGVNVWPVNCDVAAGSWPADPCDPAEGFIKDGDRSVPSETFEPIVVWGFDQCAPDEPGSVLAERAEHNLRLGERGVVEQHYMTRALADAGSVTGVADVVAAVGAAEAALAPLRFSGVLHAAPSLAAVLQRYGLIVRSGAVLRSPLGHVWSFGAGYMGVDGFTAGTIVGTSQVTVWRDAPSVRTALDPNSNTRVAVAERMVLPWHECAPVAVSFDGEVGP